MKTIIWDVDDVLKPTMRGWFEKFWLPNHPECLIKSFEQITKNPPYQLLQVEKIEYLKSLDEFRLSKLAEEIQPIPETLKWFEEHGENFRHIALTGTSFQSASLSAKWVLNHFGKWIRGFHFIPASRPNQVLPDYDKDKIDWLKWINKADILVEDSLSVIEAAEKLGIQGILFPCPWNGSKITIEKALSQLE